MIVGVGIDVVAVARVAALLERHGRRFLARCFADGEPRRLEAEHLAGLMAAKEACFKALGTGWGSGVTWHDVTVARAATGSPFLDLTGNASVRAAQLGASRSHLSISHDAGLAVAVVILEAERGEA